MIKILNDPFPEPHFTAKYKQNDMHMFIVLVYLLTSMHQVVV